MLRNIHENEILKNYDINFGGVFYRDLIDCEEDEYISLGSVDDLKKGMAYVEADEEEIYLKIGMGDMI